MRAAVPENVDDLDAISGLGQLGRLQDLILALDVESRGLGGGMGRDGGPGDHGETAQPSVHHRSLRAESARLAERIGPREQLGLASPESTSVRAPELSAALRCTRSPPSFPSG